MASALYESDEEALETRKPAPTMINPDDRALLRSMDSLRVEQSGDEQEEPAKQQAVQKKVDFPWKEFLLKVIGGVAVSGVVWGLVALFKYLVWGEPFALFSGASAAVADTGNKSIGQLAQESMVVVAEDV